MTSKRRYSDDDRANALAALAANGGNVSRTARQLGIPVRTLAAWARGERHEEAAEMCQEKKGLLVDRLKEIAWRLAEAIDNPARLQRASLSQVATAFGIVTDKIRLLEGQATAINENRHDHRFTLTPEDIAAVEALEAAADRDVPHDGGPQ